MKPVPAGYQGRHTLTVHLTLIPERAANDGHNRRPWMGMPAQSAVRREPEVPDEDIGTMVLDRSRERCDVEARHVFVVARNPTGTVAGSTSGT